MSVGKVPGQTEGTAQASLERNHDNPVSGTHQAPCERNSPGTITLRLSVWVETSTDTYQKTFRGKEGLGAKSAKAAAHKKPT